MLLPGTKDFSQIGVKNKDLHFVTAGSKGSMAGRLLRPVPDLLPPHTFLFPLLAPGVLRVWEAGTARCVYTQTLDAVSKEGEEEAASAAEEEEKEDDPRSLTHLLHLPVSSRLATVTAEHNIVLYQLPGLTTQQQVGIQNNTLRI